MSGPDIVLVPLIENPLDVVEEAAAAVANFRVRRRALESSLDAFDRAYGSGASPSVPFELWPQAAILQLLPDTIRFFRHSRLLGGHQPRDARRVIERAHLMNALDQEGARLQEAADTSLRAHSLGVSVRVPRAMKIRGGSQLFTCTVSGGSRICPIDLLWMETLKAEDNRSLFRCAAALALKVQEGIDSSSGLHPLTVTCMPVTSSRKRRPVGQSPR